MDGCEILHHQKDGWNPINDGINNLSTGAGFRNHPPYHILSLFIRITQIFGWFLPLGFPNYPRKIWWDVHPPDYDLLSDCSAVASLCTYQLVVSCIPGLFSFCFFVSDVLQDIFKNFEVLLFCFWILDHSTISMYVDVIPYVCLESSHIFLNFLHNPIPHIQHPQGEWSQWLFLGGPTGGFSDYMDGILFGFSEKKPWINWSTFSFSAGAHAWRQVLWRAGEALGSDAGLSAADRPGGLGPETVAGCGLWRCAWAADGLDSVSRSGCPRWTGGVPWTRLGCWRWSLRVFGLLWKIWHESWELLQPLISQIMSIITKNNVPLSYYKQSYPRMLTHIISHYFNGNFRILKWSYCTI